MKQIYSPYDTDETVRTQITLTRSLKEKIEKRAASLNVSLAEVLRQAAWVYLQNDEKEREDYEKLAESAVGIVNLDDHPEWKNRQKIGKWVRKIRAEWK